jgi:hypothetical protein
MPLFGPRIDDPTGAGTDGRPRTTSLLAATVVLLCYLVAVIGWGDIVDGETLLDTVAGVLGLAGAIALVGVAVALIATDEPEALFAGIVLLFPAGSFALRGLLDFSAETVSITGNLLAAGAGLAVGLSLVAAAATWGDGIGSGAVSRTLQYGAFTLVATIGLLTLVIAVTVAAVATVTPPDGLGLTGFLGLVGLVGGTLWFALRTLPLRQLTPRPERARMTALLDQCTRVAIVLTVLGGGGWFYLSAGFLFVDPESLLPAPAYTALSLVTGSVPPRVGLLALALVLATAGAVATALRQTGVSKDDLASRWGPVVAGAILLALAAQFALLVTVTDPDPSAVLFRIVIIAFLFVFIGLLTLLALATLPVLAVLGDVLDSVAGPALMATGPIAAALFLGAAHAPAWLVVGGAVAGLLVWDLATYGQSLTTEVGWTPDTRRVETVHATGAVVGALVVGLAAVGVHAAVTTPGDLVSRPAIILLGLAAVVLVWLLGR